MAKYDFLEWCVKVAQSKFDKGEFSSGLGDLAEEAFKKGFFQADKPLVDFIVRSGAAILQQNVRALAAALTDPGPFFIQRSYTVNDQMPFDPGSIYISKPDLNGVAQYLLKDPPQVSEDQIKQWQERYDQAAQAYNRDEQWVEKQVAARTEESNRVPGVYDDLPLNDLAMRFYGAVDQYAKDKGWGLNDIPLRVCKYKKCDKVFLGLTRRQACCSKRHGELVWHQQKFKKKGEKQNGK